MLPADLGTRRRPCCRTKLQRNHPGHRASRPRGPGDPRADRCRRGHRPFARNDAREIRQGDGPDTCWPEGTVATSRVTSSPGSPGTGSHRLRCSHSPGGQSASAIIASTRRAICAGTASISAVRTARHNLKAQNLVVFCQIAEGIDEETWMFHLHRGDYSRWFRHAIKDEYLARRDGAHRTPLGPRALADAPDDPGVGECPLHAAGMTPWSIAIAFW